MVVRIRSITYNILVIYTISLLLSSRIPLVASNLLGEENLNQIDESNQTGAIESQTVQSNGHALSDSLNSETKSSDIVANEPATIPIETKSDIIDDISSRPIASSIVDNQTSDDQQQSPSTKSNRSSINSFEEWKQQQLQADLSKNGETASANSPKGNPSPTKKGKLRKNFASASCGAKILAHNAESQNVASILSSSPDEYMLNPCNAKIWFVIELCESIRVLNIEIANFELFSSVPKTFRVSSSDRFPTKDWHRHHLGTFNASFNRTLQSFQTMESTIYAKYVKFELLDFHGHEHYCPLSVVRIHGSNVEDEMMTGTESTNLIDSKSKSNIQDENENENDDDDDDDNNNNLSNDQQVGGIIGSAILDLAKRVFRRPTVVRETTSTTQITITETHALKPDCNPSVLSDSINNDTFKLWRRNDAFKQCVAEFLRGLWSQFDTCTMYLSHNCFKLNDCCKCPLIAAHKIKFHENSTLNLYINPCGYYHILTNQFVCQKEKSTEFNQTIFTNSNHELNYNHNEKNSTIYKNDNSTINDEVANLSNNKSTNKLNNISNETHLDHISNRTNEQIPSNNNIFNETILVLEPSILSNSTTNQSSVQSSSSETIHFDPNLTEPTIDAATIDEIIKTSASSTPTINTNEALSPIISSPWLKNLLINSKSLPELFKIIEKLNFNLTLSNRYLQELSEHYVKKLDETQQTSDLLRKASKAADKKLENLEEYLTRLEQNFNQMSFRIIKLEAWIPLIVFTMLCSFVWSIFTTCYLLQLRRKLKSFTYVYEKEKKFNLVEKRSHDEDDDDKDSIDDISFICNGIKKRKLSTDSNDSNPNRSQRVPDLSLPKIKENGIHKQEHKIKRKHSKHSQHILSLTRVQT